MRTSVLITIVLLSALAAVPVRAQTVGDCERGTAEADLDINDVRARVFNGGNLFFGNDTNDGSGYLVPKNTGHSPIFAADLWVGGMTASEIRLSGTFYDGFKFWPGPLDAEGRPPQDCSQYDRIWRVSRGDVARYHETGVATDDLRDWPVDLGAPVLDGDGVAGNYDLAGGDEPAISGEQMAWWVMNDLGDEHYPTEAPAVGLEVRVEAFAAASRIAAIHQATLFRYRLRYRGAEPLDSAYVALWADTDLGYAGDDYVGSDTTLEMAFTYNAQEEDDEYGVPPAFGILALRTPRALSVGQDNDGDGATDEVGEPLGLSAHYPFCYDDFSGPFNALGYYRCLKGVFRDGESIREGGFGRSEDGPVTTIMFAGDPVTEQFWSEENLDGSGEDAPAGDWGLWPSFGPFRLEPGEETVFVIALPFAQGSDRLDSIVKLRATARYLQDAYNAGFFEPQRVGALPEPPVPPEAVTLSRPFPNPFRNATAFTLTVPEDAGAMRLAVYDVLGREVAVLADGTLAPGAHPLTLGGSTLPAGVYFVRLETGRQTKTLKLLHIE